MWNNYIDFCNDWATSDVTFIYSTIIALIVFYSIMFYFGFKYSKDLKVDDLIPIMFGSMIVAFGVLAITTCLPFLIGIFVLFFILSAPMYLGYSTKKYLTKKKNRVE